MSNQPQFDRGDEVTIKYRQMDIPCRVVERRPAFGHWDYQVELLDDGEQVSEWIRETNLDPYNG